MKPALKPILDFGPLLAFFITFKAAGLATATLILIVATLATLAALYLLERKLAMAPLVTAIVVTVFGGLTLYLKDESFIKMKPTLIYLIFASLLLGGLALGKPMLKYIFGHTLPLAEAGWFRLSLRWGLFFLLLAALNEFVRRNYSTDMWVDFKVFGALGLTILFTLAQYPLIRKYWVEEDS